MDLQEGGSMKIRTGCGALRMADQPTPRAPQWPTWVLAGPAALLALALPVRALINLSLTPVDLVRSAGSISVVEGTPDAAIGVIQFRVLEVLKGEAPSLGRVDITVVAGEEDIHSRLEQKTIRDLLFTGDFQAAQEGTEAAVEGMLHLGTSWFGLQAAAEGHRAVEDTLDLKAVWDGGSVPLQRAVQYVVKARAPVIPVESGLEWTSTTTGPRIGWEPTAGPCTGSTNRPTRRRCSIWKG